MCIFDKTEKRHTAEADGEKHKEETQKSVDGKMLFGENFRMLSLSSIFILLPLLHSFSRRKIREHDKHLCEYEQVGVAWCAEKSTFTIAMKAYEQRKRFKLNLLA